MCQTHLRLLALQREKKMDKVKILADIYEKQEVLTGRILANIGVSYDEVMCNAQGDCPTLAPEWVENFRKALSSEYVEYIASDPATKNAKIEAIDMLHFLVSLSQIVGIPPYVAIDSTEDLAHFSGVNLMRGMVVTLDNLQNACKWKWWASGGGFKLDEAQLAVEDLWSLFAIIIGTLNMDWVEIHDLYMKKNAVNHERQDAGYNEDTKTEEDNESIELATDDETFAYLSGLAVAADSTKIFDYEEACRSEVSPEEVVSPDGEIVPIPPGPSCGGMMMLPCIVPPNLVAITPMIYEPEDSDGEE